MSPQFYAAVTERLRQCDLLVVEGVSGHSVLGWALTLTYRVMPVNKRSWLLVDNIPYRSLGVELIISSARSAVTGMSDYLPCCPS